MHNNKKISYFLQNFLHNFTKQYITVEEIKDKMNRKAFASLMLFFSLPNLIPLPIPGISTILGTPLIILSLQFMRGKKTPWLPKWVGRKKISYEQTQKTIEYIVFYIKKIERIFKPRMTFMLEGIMEKLIAFLCLAASIIMALPIPFANWLPAMSIFIFSLAILEKDGLLAILGLFVFIFSITLTYKIIFTLLKGSFYFLDRVLSI